MPFATDDFLPSLSVSDELFILGSSKALAVKIDKAAERLERLATVLSEEQVA